MDDLDGKAPESSDIIRGSPGIPLMDKKWCLRDGSGNESDFETNVKHAGHKKHETMTPTIVGGSLGDDFFHDIESCSTEPANLDEVTFLFASSHFLL